MWSVWLCSADRHSCSKNETCCCTSSMCCVCCNNKSVNVCAVCALQQRLSKGVKTSLLLFTLAQAVISGIFCFLLFRQRRSFGPSYSVRLQHFLLITLINLLHQITLEVHLSLDYEDYYYYISVKTTTAEISPAFPINHLMKNIFY